MLDDNAYGLSRRRVTVSTSGVVPDDRPAGARTARWPWPVSLHAPNDALRDDLVPLNNKYPHRRSCWRPASATWRSAPRDFITFEYCMLDGVNDQPEHARELVALVQAHAARGLSCKFNLIPFNPLPGVGPAAFRHAASQWPSHKC